MSHYSTAYFEWQKNIGNISGIAQKFLFEKFTDKTKNVLEFGCGGGFLLKNLDGKEKIGIEINPEARAFGIENGLNIVENISKIPDDWADVIISNHVLEHTHNPLEELMSLYPKLKKGGQIIFVVPHEEKVKFSPNDINQHLYTWSEMNLGNLFVKSGFNILKVREIHHRYPPFSKFILERFGLKMFHILAYIYGFVMANKISQIRIIASK
jgi:SAM-dependent methyltransferase